MLLSRIYPGATDNLVTLEGNDMTEGVSPLAINEMINPGQLLDPETGLEVEIMDGTPDVNDLFAQADTRENQRIIDSIVGDTPKEVSSDFLTHLMRREGSRNETYADSLGKLTGGVGHLLSAEEKKKYPKGTAIPEEVTKAWLKEDSVKAMEAAKKQASEIGVEKEEFINALASVNFQLGTKWNTIHKGTWKLIKQGKYSEAAKEAANSKWFKQTPVRVKDFQEALRLI